MVTVPVTDVDALRSQLQGNIVVPYRLASVRHIVLGVTDAARARAWLSQMLRSDGAEPTITADGPSEREHPGPCVNVGITYAGLEALGVPPTSLGTFPPEFREGMFARAARLGDVGVSGPATWVESLRRWHRVHVLLTVHAQTPAQAEATACKIVAMARGALSENGHFDGEALVQTASGEYDLYSNVDEIMNDGTPITHKRGEHFGFRDGLSQPRFRGITSGTDDPDMPAPDSDSTKDPYEPLGVILLGHPNRSPISVPVPQPSLLGCHGTFNAFRVLAQDVAGFRRYIAAEAEKLGVEPELLRAKICGRWPDGTPLADGAKHLNDFDFSDDQEGRMCPVGAHIRRTNPRAAQIVQRPSNRSRRLVRRGMPFGPWLPEGQEAAHPHERGLLGSFLCASLSTQFEAMQYDWINLGLQDPTITSLNDPLVGANDPASSRFRFHDGQQWRTIDGIPRFVETMGGAYCFVPSMPALRWIADAAWAPGGAP